MERESGGREGDCENWKRNKINEWNEKQTKR